MPLQPLSLGYSSDPTKYGQEGACRLMNCYAVKTDNGRYPFAVYGVDGCAQWGDSGIVGPVRATFEFDPFLLTVVGRSIVSFDATGTATAVGGLASDGPVYAARNRKSPNAQVGLVADGVFKLFENGTVRDIEDSDLPAAISIAALDGYFLLPTRDGRLFYTSIDEGSEIDGLDFFTAESNPDIAVRNVTRGRDHITLGLKSLEFHANTGGADSPFTRTTTRDVGCYAAGSVQVLTVSRRDGTSVDTVFFAATDNQGAPIGVHMLSGYDPILIGPDDLTRKIADSSPDSITSLAWSKDGQSFYQINGLTWSYVYNFATGFWHEVSTYQKGRHRANTYAYFAGKHIIGDFEDGKLYELRSDVYTDGGLDLISYIQPPAVHAAPKKLKWDSLHADMIVGVGEVSASDYIANPVVMMSYSDDGGRTWSAERTEELGATAQIHRSIDFHRLGIAPVLGRTVRLAVSAPVKRGWLGIHANLTAVG